VPAETHEHYDADGVLTGTTVVQRESEWTDLARERALALGVWEASRCGSCGNYGTLVMLPSETRHVTWEDHEGRKVEVYQMRCLTCGAMDLLKRDFAKAHEKDKPKPGQAMATDGHTFTARPIDEED
jgi:hypothetical protein